VDGGCLGWLISIPEQQSVLRFWVKDGVLEVLLGGVLDG
jgi:hypothetical protein